MQRAPNSRPCLPPARAIGARTPKVDGVAKLTGEERYGADAIPADALWLRVVRSPHHHASFELGDLAAFAAAHPGIERVLSARDVPSNGFGIYPHIKDQPVLADGVARFRGEAVLALVGTRAAVEAVADDELPLRYTALPPVMGIAAAAAPNAPLVQADKPDNILLDGWVRKGDAAAAFASCAAIAEATFETGFVEHAYIEPEAGWARRVGERLEIHVTTQTPYMDRDEMALVMKLRREQIRIVPTACGGGFGGKLDLSVQPLIGLAAWLLNGRSPASIPGRRAWPRAPSAIRRASASNPAATRTASWSRRNRRPTSTPAPMRAGVRPWPRACRSMRAAPTSCRMSRRAAARISPTAIHPAHFAASACRKARSRTKP